MIPMSLSRLAMVVQAVVLAALAVSSCRYLKPKPCPECSIHIVTVPVTWPAVDPVYKVDGYFLAITPEGECGTSGTDTKGQCKGILDKDHEVCLFAHNSQGDGPKECQHEDFNRAITFAVAPTPNPLPPPPPVLPPAPTRDQVLNVHITFQGLIFHSDRFGDMPSFEGCTAWFTPQERQSLYAAKKVQGDTHAIIAIPSGRPCYDEPNQAYSPDRFPTLDWTNGQAGPMAREFRSLVVEQIRSGFRVLVFLDERQPVSYATLPLVIQALQQGPEGDLTPYVMILPGWDGVFYGWEPSQQLIPGWASKARQTCPACNLGIEFNTGHIPVGNGPADYAPGGLMKDYDSVFVEFGGIHDDATWQILGRLLGPLYHRPADQPAGDDPSPPWYLRTPNPRGPWGVTCFEFGFDEYNWVRGRVTVDVIQQHRQYLQSVGCNSIG